MIFGTAKNGREQSWLNRTELWQTLHAMHALSELMSCERHAPRAPRCHTSTSVPAVILLSMSTMAAGTFWLWLLDAHTADLGTDHGLLEGVTNKVLNKIPIHEEPALLTLRHLLRYLLEESMRDNPWTVPVATCLIKVAELLIEQADYVASVVEVPELLLPPESLLVEVIWAFCILNTSAAPPAPFCSVAATRTCASCPRKLGG